MAKVTGTSGAWKEVYDRLRDEGVPVTHPREIQTELNKIKQGYDEWVAKLFVEVGNEISAFEQQVVTTQSDAQQRIERMRAETSETIAGYDARLEQLRQATGFFRRLLNRFKITAVKLQRENAGNRMQHGVASLENTMADLTRRLEAMKTNKGSLVVERRQGLDRTIERLEMILQSKELAGAQAEMEVAEHLSKLPDSYHVFHDVQLQAHHFLRDREGVPLQSAQCDHVVLAPFGVFVIETKNWSRQFVEDGDGFSPFAQVERANRLCYALLGDFGCKTKVRSIIATPGKLPSKAEGQHVKVMQPHELNGYIVWFKSKESPLERERFEDICEFLTQHTGTHW